jgi:YidC/Oxa1 family membrane protein insertase
MVYVMPFFTFFIGLSLPSGLALYWIISILFTILQQYLVFVKKEKQPAKVE